jgi:dephospho-CoA kinase
MKRIALTGGIACGKSVLAGFLAECGCDVLDADALAHALEAPGGAAVALIVAAFGPDMRAADGGIDRCRLGQKVFADEAARLRLNGIVHPLVKEALARWLATPGNHPKVAVIPLLFEVGWEVGWDVVVCVACAEAEQMRRLQARGLSAAAARARVASQLPLADKVRRADGVVWNDGSLDALRREARRLKDAWAEKKT